MANNDHHDGPISPHRHHYHNYHRDIMITAISAVSFIIILVFILHTYTKCVLRRHVRLRSAARHIGLAVSHARAIDQPTNGLDPIVIASLPLFQFKKNGEHEDNMVTAECSVCLSLLEDGELARSLPNCKHTFHAECIDKWFNKHNTCPICRTEAEPRPVHEPREAPTVFAPTTPPLERINSSLSCMEGTSDMSCLVQQSRR